MRLYAEKSGIELRKGQVQGKKLRNAPGSNLLGVGVGKGVGSFQLRWLVGDGAITRTGTER